MSDSRIASLLKNLKDPHEDVRDQATEDLWRIWFGQKGALGLEAIRRSQLLLETGDVLNAEAVLSELIESQPDFAEAWNRRAVLHYMQGRYRAAIADCERVIRLNPIHFGALHGLGLCHVALGEYSAAIAVFRQALEIQPFSLAHQRWILECTAKLS
ncbi:tetratricopeptide repeat protein [Leptolyngbya sp. FACHB-36]|uniref:tetratricopeptide repeat protein n=1 Tax=Leptolyngbya sp. FACHB-36 TaxID=2692808 RepID=UPI0016811F11|nr:tetratricopeptide repeat protein [Leptolyngbya sp. FACHB-36]MBD2020917.1 tetratricopeptide repeat protein [Leptolyngbya sp. FACHB-36]